MRGRLAQQPLALPSAAATAGDEATEGVSDAALTADDGVRDEPLGAVEARLLRQGIWPVIGTDEAGRGPLFGPVVAAAVVIEPAAAPIGLHDSKRLTEAEREALLPQIAAAAVAFAVVAADSDRIGRDTILRASLWAMEQAVRAVLAQLEAKGLPRPRLLLVDGNRAIAARGLPPQRTLVKGDARSVAVAAASVLAKVERDRQLVALDAEFPGYGLARHKGYPTPEHLEALRRLGPTSLHRRGFAPVDAAWAQRQARL